MRAFKDVLKGLREEKMLSQKELADELKLGYSTIGMYENGSRMPKYEILEMIADYFNVDMNYLLGKTPIRNSYRDINIYASAGIDYIRIPLYSNLCCGDGGFVEDNILEYVPVPSKGLSTSSEYFAQIAEGMSMKDAGIYSGDLLVFEKTNRVDNNVIGCFCVDDNVATCKKYSERNGMIMLLPMNSDYEVIYVDPMNSSFKCLGRLKKIIKDVE